MAGSKKFPTVALINDTSLYSNHFGCELVCQVFREQFKRLGLDLVLALPKRFDLDEYSEELNKVDLIVINGEGTLHHDKFSYLIDLAAIFPCVLVNCVFQANSPNKNLKNFLYVSTRESLSAAEIRKNSVNCDVVPDLIFASTFARVYPKQKMTKKLGITDNVVKEYHGVWPFRWRVKGFSATGQSAGLYLKNLMSCERIASGRFHAAVLCAVKGIPFSTWDSNTWKTQALMNDMGVSHLHFGSRQEAIRNVPEVFPEQISAFVEQARVKIDQMFNQIYAIAVEQQNLRTNS
jgi:hypothetical protein